MQSHFLIYYVDREKKKVSEILVVIDFGQVENYLLPTEILDKYATEYGFDRSKMGGMWIRSITGNEFMNSVAVRLEKELVMYHLFAYHNYYPEGGMNDYVGAFDTIEKAKLWVAQNTTFSHAHIVQLKDDKIWPVSYWRQNEWKDEPNEQN